MAYGNTQRGGGLAFFLLISAICGFVIVGGVATLVYAFTRHSGSGVSDIPVTAPTAGDSAQPTDTPTGSDTVSSGTREYLPRVDPTVTGIAALSAECRDIWYTQHGGSVDVALTFTGPGNVSVDVYPEPGDGSNVQHQLYTVGSDEAGHRFAFSGVAGRVDHVLITVTAAQGVDQCYARKG